MRNQVLHIFRKDVHHHWPEIAASMVALAAFGWHTAAHLNPLNSMPEVFEFLLSILAGLLPLTWIYLVIRVVHGENLVGDRQFWVTRPYDWKKLLAAKVLFIFVFVNIPLFLVQFFLLAYAGFPVKSHLAGLLLLQLLWTGFVILPAVTLATVTAGIGQFILIVFGTLLTFVAAVGLLSFIPNAGVEGTNSIPVNLAVSVFLAATLVTVFRQYIRRAAASSRILLAGAAGLIAATFALTPYGLLINRLYPLTPAGQQVPVTLAFDPAKPASHGQGRRERNQVRIQIPLLASGIAGDTVVRITGENAIVQTPDGGQWKRGWHGSGQPLVAETHHLDATISMDREFFDRVKSTPVNVHLSFALAPSVARQTSRVTAQATGFALPGEGRCSFSPFDIEAVSCTFPLKGRPLLLAVRSEELTCAPGEKEIAAPAGITLYSEISSTWPFGLNPLKSINLSFWTPTEVNIRDFRPHICPGTPLTVLEDWRDLPRYRQDLQINGIRLADYQAF